MHTNVILIGDSITEGIGASDPAKTSYAAVLGRLLGEEYTVENFGRNGATLNDPPNGKNDSYLRLSHYERAKAAARDACARKERTVVSIMLGTNDADVIDYGFVGRGEAFFARYHDAFVAGMLSIVDAFHEIDPHCVFILCKSPYSYDGIKHTDYGNLEGVWAFQQEIYETVKRRGIGAVQNDLSVCTSPEALGREIDGFFADRLHPNDCGHAKIAEVFYDAVKAAEKEF